MQVTLSGTLLRIQWQPLSDAIEAAILARLQGIPTAMPGNVERTWYVHLDRLNDVMAAFGKAEYAPEVIAAYPVDSLGKTSETSFTQGALWDVEAIRQKDVRTDYVRKRNRYGKRKGKR